MYFQSNVVNSDNAFAYSFTLAGILNNNFLKLTMRIAVFVCLMHLIVSVRSPPRNVLLIVSDDMRPDIGVYQHETPAVRIVTPNLDKLASRSFLVKNAYVQQAVCSPSRTSMLTGRRPDTTRVHDLTQYWRHVAGNFTTLPEYFKHHGYNTAGLGKIFHPGRPSGHDDPPSWTEPYFHPDETYWQAKTNNTWFAAELDELSEHPLADMQTLRAALDTLKRLSAESKPFFLAVGFMKPHLPFIFPKSFLDLYPSQTIQLPKNPFAPDHMPEIAWSHFDELRKYNDILTRFGFGSINSTLPDSLVLSLRRAYYSSISYVDSLVGQLVDGLTAAGLDSETVVMFLGDHGWQLGEHGEWCKHTNFELSVRAPMMLRIPGLTEMGLVTEELVEFVDVFPTLADAVGLPVPSLCPEESRQVALCVEGVSLMRLILSNSFSVDRRIQWKSAAFSQYPRMQSDGDVMMGYSMRTSRYRFTEWPRYDINSYRPMWSEHRLSVELYDHLVDPDENHNTANDPQYSVDRKRLSAQLRAGWRAALPPHNRRYFDIESSELYTFL